MKGVALHPVRMSGVELTDQVCSLPHHHLGVADILSRELVSIQADCFGHILGENRELLIALDHGFECRSIEKAGDVDEDLLPFINCHVHYISVKAHMIDSWYAFGLTG
jgi:hypothetical protein